MGGGGGWVNGGQVGGPGTPPVGPPPRSPVLGTSVGASGNYFGGEQPQRRDSLQVGGMPMRRQASEDAFGSGGLGVEGAGLGLGLSGRDSPSLGARGGWDSPVSMSPRMGAVSGFESVQGGGAAGLSKRK